MKLLAKILGLALAVAATFAACGAAASLALGSTPLGRQRLGHLVRRRVAQRDPRASTTAATSRRSTSARLPAACAGETLSVTLAR